MRRGLPADELEWYREDVGRDEEPGWLSVSAAPVPHQPGLLGADAAQAAALHSLEIEEHWDPWACPLANFRLQAAADALEARVPPRDDMYPSHFLRLWSDGLLEFGYLLEPELRQPEHARVLPRLAIAHYIHDYLALFAAIYGSVGYAGSVATRVALSHLSGYTLGVQRGGGAAPPRIAGDTIEVTDVGIEVGALAPGLVAKSVLDEVFVAAGIAAGCPFVDAEGHLIR